MLYRIVRDNYAGYEVQCRPWWWPFWYQAGFVNTHVSLERAEQYALEHSKRYVKYLGNLSKKH